jgi:hypothetical protein
MATNKMKIAVMQPYIFPYIGYYQLINAADVFVVYDNIKFTKKGWINRNRILVDGRDKFITIPIKKDSDYLNVSNRYLADTWPTEKKSMLNRIRAAYKKAPHFDTVYPVIEKCLLFEDRNLFSFLLNSIKTITSHLKISTPIIISSDLNIDHQLRSEKKVIAICKSCEAQSYINPIGGLNLYSKEEFKTNGIDLYFLKTGKVAYTQSENEFMPFLSVIDVLMFNSVQNAREMLNKFELI